MVSPRGHTQDHCIVASEDLARLQQLCPDLNQWARSWCCLPQDLAVGQQIVELLTPFLLELLHQGLDQKTARRHRDNLWALGGALIRRRHEDDDLARLNPTQILKQLVEDDVGPLLWPRISESEQNSLDTTCRKLYRFLRDSKPASD